jgi:coenzyme Q-binding protein COQ10
MPSFSMTRRVPFTPVQMFDLVADVEQYPKFLPLCEGLRVRSRSIQGDVETIVADMDVGYKAIRETFTSRVHLDRPRLAVHTQFVEGPFRSLDNKWSFTAVPEGTDVHFFIAYEFKSMMLQMLAGAVFEKAFRRFAEAFEARARVVYGNPEMANGVLEQDRL